MLLLLSHFSRVRLCDPIDGSPPGSPIPGILQARTLEWVAISFSNAWKWKVKVKSLSCVQLLATPWTAAHQAPPSMGYSRQEYWNVVPSPSPDILQIRGGFSDMPTLNGLGSFMSVLKVNMKIWTSWFAWFYGVFWVKWIMYHFWKSPRGYL